MSPRRGTSPRRRRLAAAIAFLSLLTLAAAGAAAWLWHHFHQPYGETATAEVTIANGTSVSEILQRLEGEGVIENADLARLYLIHVLGDPPLRAGEYRFNSPLSAPQALDQMIRGEVITRPVTLIEGLVLEEIAEHLATEGFGDRDAFLRYLRDPALISDLDPEAPNLEGYVFPDTYRFASGTSEEQIVETTVRTFRQRWTQQVEPLLPRDGERPSVREVVTLASIVEKEAQLEDERPIIAGVYAHRLERGIALYADPTVIYALRLEGRWDGNIRRTDLRLDHPYNTYVYPGLPPGPIANPGLGSLQAAARPADVPYLYFVSRNDGSHVFARTLAEHNRNVDRWQKRYWRERWAKERQQKQQEAESEGKPTPP
ncbi:MAG: endolytic transglycosylase MltG [Acidobacteriota bacterium]